MEQEHHKYFTNITGASGLTLKSRATVSQIIKVLGTNYEIMTVEGDTLLAIPYSISQNKSDKIKEINQAIYPTSK